MKRNAFGMVLVLLGVAAILAALVLLIFNLRSENKAGEQSEAVLQALKVAINDSASVPSESMQPMQPDGEEPTGNLPVQEQPVQQPELPESKPSPERELPEKEVDGRAYVGVLTIPSLDLELPILSQWSKDGVKVAPCRLEGTPYQNDLILGAHNYTFHFGKLSLLKTGDLIYFADLNGEVFTYEAVSFEVLRPNQGDILRDEQWDLSLFTCTLSGRTRFTVRCQFVAPQGGADS